MTSPVRPGRAAALWAGPVVVILLIAVASEFFGLLGAVLVAGCAMALVMFSAAEALGTARARRGAVYAAVSAVVAVVALFVQQGALPLVRALDVGSGGVLDRRGDRVAPEDTARLRGSLLAGADLRGLDLRGLDLAGADGPGASLRDADLSGASLRGADLRGADLRGACLAGADLEGTQLAGAMVEGAAVVLPPDTLAIGTPLDTGSQAPSCK